MTANAWGVGSDIDQRPRKKGSENPAMHAARIEAAKRFRLAKALAHDERQHRFKTFLFTVILLVGVGAMTWAAVDSEWWQQLGDLLIGDTPPTTSHPPIAVTHLATSAIQTRLIDLSILNQETLSRICRTTSRYSAAACLLWTERDQAAFDKRQQVAAQASADAIARQNQEAEREASSQSEPNIAPQYSQGGIDSQKSARLAHPDHQM